MRHFQYLVAVLLAFIIVGCASPQGLLLRQQAKQIAQKVADENLKAALFIVCKGASVGAVNRKFGNNAKVYKLFCQEATGNIIGK